MASNNWQEKLAALRESMGDMEPETAQTDSPATTANTVKGPEKERLDIILEKKGRGGKTATIICGFTIGNDDIEELASKMKRALATGGSSRGGEILIQGDRRADVLRFLTENGYKARLI